MPLRIWKVESRIRPKMGQGRKLAGLEWQVRTGVGLAGKGLLSTSKLARQDGAEQELD